MPKRHADPTLERLWRRRLDQWRQSGLTVRVYCAAHALPEHSFYAWRRELRRRDTRPATTPAFVPGRVVPPPAAVPLELVLAGGRTVRIAPGFDADTLRRLLATLDLPSEGPPC